MDAEQATLLLLPGIFLFIRKRPMVSIELAHTRADLSGFAAIEHQYRLALRPALAVGCPAAHLHLLVVSAEARINGQMGCRALIFLNFRSNLGSNNVFKVKQLLNKV